MKEIYFDHAATTYVRPEVVEVMKQFHEDEFGNPGSFHYKGLLAKNALSAAREKIAKILKCNASEIVFTGGGTESCNLAIKGVARSMKKGHIITSKIEHDAVMDSCDYLERHEGFDITYVDVDEQGIVNVDDVKKAIRDDTILISIMYANNEIGTIQPIKDISKIARENDILFHTDACQASGALSLDVDADLMTLNASKIYGPKGVGLLYVRRGVRLVPLIHGGGQENRLRSGTENVSGIVGFAKALELAQSEKEMESARLKEIRDYLIKRVTDEIPECWLNGHPEKRLANNANITFLNIEGEAIILLMNEYKIYVSSGSACTSKTLDPSHVIVAMGMPYEAAHGSIRFTLGKRNSKEDVDKLMEVLPEIIEKLRGISPVHLKAEEIKR
tara:strand:- start:2815 stop:3981 length:1167 start_codon:yes stop_codon:yes gene_type:complete